MMKPVREYTAAELASKIEAFENWVSVEPNDADLEYLSRLRIEAELRNFVALRRPELTAVEF